MKKDLSLKQLSAWDIDENINCLDSRAAVKISSCSINSILKQMLRS